MKSACPRSLWIRRPHFVNTRTQKDNLTFSRWLYKGTIRSNKILEERSYPRKNWTFLLFSSINRDSLRNKGPTWIVFFYIWERGQKYSNTFSLTELERKLFYSFVKTTFCKLSTDTKDFAPWRIPSWKALLSFRVQPSLYIEQRWAVCIISVTRP